MSDRIVTHLDSKWTSIVFNDTRVSVWITGKDGEENLITLDVKDGKLVVFENVGLRLMSPEEAAAEALAQDIADLLDAI